MKSEKLLTSIFLVCLGFFLVAESRSKPRILVLHSYNTDFSWVTDVNTGLGKVLGGKPVSVRYQYMDTKRHPGNVFKKSAGQEARRVIDSWEPNVLISVDDNAQEYAAKYYRNKPGIAIVFAGVNGKLSSYGYDTAKNVTGILERIPYRTFKNAFLSMTRGKYRRILHVSDASETSRYIDDELTSFNWAPLKLAGSVQCSTFDQWKKTILRARKCADFIMITQYHTIKRSKIDSSIVPPKQVIQWTTKHSKTPTIGSWGFFVDDGGPLAIALSPYEEGEVAAQMALDIIDKGLKPKQIPVKKSKLFLIYVRETGIRRLNIKLPSLFDAFARATGHYYQ